MRLNLKNAAMILTLSLAVFPAAPQEVQASAAQPGVSSVSVPVRTITIHAKKYKFDPSAITLTIGQTVHLELTSDDVKHSLRVPGLGIDGIMKKGKITEVTVTPENVGDYKGTCSVFCGFGHGHMHFVVHVVR